MLYFILHSRPKSSKVIQPILHIELRVSNHASTSKDIIASTCQIAGSREETMKTLERQLPPHARKNGEKALHLLIQEEISYRRSESLKQPSGMTSLSRIKEERDPFSLFRIRPSAAFSTLEELSSIGSLYVGNERMIFDRLSNPIGIQIQAHRARNKERTLELSLFSKNEKKPMPIPSGKVLFFSSAPLLIAHGTLIQKIDDSISWKSLLPFFKGTSKAVIDASLQWDEWKEHVIEEMNEEGSALNFIESEQLDALTQEHSAAPPPLMHGPLPILRLHHSYGMTASLLMEYALPNEPTPRIVQYRRRSDFEKQMKMKEPWRNLEQEKSWENDLIECGFIYGQDEKGEDRYFCSSEKSQEAIKTLLEIGWKAIDQLGRPIHIVTDIEIGISKDALDGDAYSITSSIQTLLQGNEKKPFSEFPLLLKELQKQSARRGTKASHQAPSCQILSCGAYSLFLPLTAYSDLEELAEEIEITAGKATLPSYKIGLLHRNHSHESDSMRQSDECTTAIAGKSHVSLDFRGTLYPYQQEGVAWLSSCIASGRSALLADEMGLGKTVQILAWIAESTFSSPILIIVPKSLLFNWKREIERFLPSISMKNELIEFHGEDRLQLKNEKERFEKAKIVLTSFHTARMEEEFLSRHFFSAIIIDEAQYIKNAESQTYRAISSIPSGRHIILTGTPVENSLSDLWSHFHLIEKRLFKEKEAFLLPFSVNSPDIERKALQKIKKLIAPYMLRRTKKLVAHELPDIIEQTVWVDMDEEEMERYFSFLASLKQGRIVKQREDTGARSTKAKRMEILEAILRLRQITCHHALFKWAPAAAEVPAAKWDLVLDDLATLASEGKKVVLFSQFATVIDLFVKEAASLGIGNNRRVVAYHGKSQNGSIEEAVDQFQNDDSVFCFMTTLKAGGVGINLTRADAVLLYDPWWNRAIEEQAIARAHRIGRKESVIVKRYITRNTIEERVWQIAEKKEALFQTLFSESGEMNEAELHSSQSASHDDFLYELLDSELHREKS